jgi:hypothetical protein
MRSFVVVLIALFAAEDVLAAPRALAIAPFGAPGSKDRDLSEALLLELTLDETLVVSPGDSVLDNLGMDPAEAVPDDISAVLLQEEMTALLRAEPIEGRPGAIVLLVHRASDGRIVHGIVVELDAALLDPVPLSTELSAAMGDIDALSPLSPAALTALRIPPTVATTTPDETPPTDGAKPTTMRDADAKPTTTPSTGAQSKPEDVAAPSTAEAPRWPFDRVLRLVVSTAPVYMRYEACQPTTSALPFMCAAKEGVPSTTTTILPHGAPLSLAGSLEATPWVPYVGLQIDALVYSTRLALKGAEGLYDGGRTDFGVMGGTFTSAFSVKGAFALGSVGVAAGARAGYALVFALAEAHYIEGPPRYDVVLLPSFFTHAAALGLTSTVSFAPWVRVAADLDLLPVVLQVENGTTVSAQPFLFGAGARGKLQLDIDIVFGLIASISLEGSTVSARGIGEGTRVTRALVPFRDGVVGVTTVRGGLGLGWHF